MDARLESLVTDLAPGAMLKVRRAAGAVLRVEHGALWITEAGRRADAILPAGASYRVERGRAVVIEALGAARVVIVPIAPVRVRMAPTPFEALARWLAPVGRALRWR